ncbi:flagellar biosynthetic protein FliR [Aminomonas paucivorans]|uniref:Flagellar biosynthetic protein FliR n=1 Tax=Aminomonas paucivorans DSM 12260 TaxID=584708 RepID=E3CVU3_9BACT|nr:flagellar biosynthetic protein FliR [Aminomonas paucivorans]EFQ23294.1 flagellar biosynthetic protein FliR [Aminomonas paucivorans DSM 12260]
MPYEELVDLLLVYLLVGLRFLGLLFSNPVFLAPAWPLPVRFWTAMLLAVVVTPGVGLSYPGPLFAHWGFLFVAAGREFLIGVTLGLFAGLPLYALQMSGFFEGTQMGLGIATFFDPMSETQVALIGQMKYLLGVWFFFHWNGHLLLIEALTESLRLIPLAKGTWGGGAAIPWGIWLQKLFVLSLQMALPLFGALLLADVGMGFVARTVPQMNLFVLGIPLKIGLGLFILLAVLPLTVDLFHSTVERAVEMALEGALLWK